MAVRRHTEVSLFNALYAALTEDGLLRGSQSRPPRRDYPRDVVELSGDFVGNPLEAVVTFVKQALPYLDIAGEVEAAPAVSTRRRVPEFTAADAEADDLARQAANAARSGNPATNAHDVEIRQRADIQRARAGGAARGGRDRAGADARHQEQLIGVRLITQVSEDLATTPVQDTVMRAMSSGPS